LTTFSRPAFSRPNCSTSGETIRHGPHQGAQKSTSTGTEAMISASNVSALGSTTHGSSVLSTQKANSYRPARERIRAGPP
jgi:hypothetical protein